jgi:transketolase
MSSAELVAGTFFYAMKFDPKDPNSPDGDRFVLSKGHAALVLYAALAEARGFPLSCPMTLRGGSSEKLSRAHEYRPPTGAHDETQ